MLSFPITISAYIAYAVYAHTIDFSQFVNCQSNTLGFYADREMCLASIHDGLHLRFIEARVFARNAYAPTEDKKCSRSTDTH